MIYYTVNGINTEKKEITALRTHATSAEQAFLNASLEDDKSFFFSAEHTVKDDTVTEHLPVPTQGKEILKSLLANNLPSGMFNTKFIWADLANDYAFQVVRNELYLHPKTADGLSFDWSVYYPGFALHAAELDVLEDSPVLEDEHIHPIKLLDDDQPYAFVPCPEAYLGNIIAPTTATLNKYAVVYYNYCTFFISKSGMMAYQYEDSISRAFSANPLDGSPINEHLVDVEQITEDDYELLSSLGYSISVYVDRDEP